MYLLSVIHATAADSTTRPGPCHYRSAYCRWWKGHNHRSTAQPGERDGFPCRRSLLPLGGAAPNQLQVLGSTSCIVRILQLGGTVFQPKASGLHAVLLLRVQCAFRVDASLETSLGGFTQVVVLRIIIQPDAHEHRKATWPYLLLDLLCSSM